MTVRLTLLTGVAVDGVEVVGERSRELVALLAAAPGTAVPAASLIAGLWPEDRPANPIKALQVVVSRTRARIGAGLVEATPVGYRLALGPEEVDASAVLRRVAEARAGEPAAALEAAEAGLALFAGAPGGAAERNGPAGAGGPERDVRWSGGADSREVGALRAAREPVLAELERSRALALSRLGRAGEAFGVLALLEHRRDEEVLVELLRSEAAVHGPAAALARYESHRRALADELGTDPGAAVRAEHARLLAESAPRRRRGIVHEPNPLLGRDADVAAVLGLLRRARVVTVLGPGGLGKTRLAHAVAARAEERTVQVVSLAGVRSGADLTAAVAEEVSGQGSRAPSPVDAILDGLGAAPALLVLDNCEHVLDAAAALVHTLVARAPGIRVLATSRAPLGLAAETVHPLPELAPAATVALFRARALAARPDADLPEAEVAALCARLDGLPLAVELAAARIRVLGVPEIRDRLADRFALLRGGARDAPERHRTLEAVVGWSWNLLPEPGRAALRLLSALPGGFTADTAGRLLGGDPLELLEALVGHSLLRPPDAAGRFGMLETVAEYAAARRLEAGESAQVTARILAWGRESGRELHAAPFGPDPKPALDRIRAEQENLIHVLRLAGAERDRATIAATAAALGALWSAESASARLMALGADTLPALSRYRPTDRAGQDTLRQLLVVYAALTLLVDPVAAARPLAVLRRLPPAPPESSMGAFARVLAVLPDTAELARLATGPQPLVAAAALGVVGYVREARGDLDGAYAAVARMREQLRPSGPVWLRSFAEARLAELALQLERHAEALAHLTAAGAALERFGVEADEIGVQLGMVLAHLGLGSPGAAERVLASVRPSETFDGQVFALTARAELDLAKGETDSGLAGWRAAAALFDGAGAPDWLGPFGWTVRAVAVVAHARRGRLAEVAGIVADLPAALDGLLGGGAPNPLCGTLLVALGVAEAAQERPVRAAWLVALAERLHYQRESQPTMSTAAIRALVAGPAYDEAAAEYAGLSAEDLRAAAAELVAAYRERV